ncbi:MAG: hypothetical protein F6K24_17685 [Okeania sp. SIO2D1]|nr:hypothetical protein [Okeania sp. SIO2D1]
MATHPQLFRNAITIIEPWEHVGINPQGEEVQASKNVAFMAQTIAYCDSYHVRWYCLCRPKGEYLQEVSFFLLLSLPPFSLFLSFAFTIPMLPDMILA